VLITAAKDYGLIGTGIEIDPIKVWQANWRVRFAGVSDKAKIVRANIFDTDYGEADILFIYHTHQAIDKLFPNTLQQLQSNATQKFSVTGSAYRAWPRTKSAPTKLCFFTR